MRLVRLRTARSARTALAVVASATLLACGGTDASGDAAEDTAAAQEDAAAATPAASQAPATPAENPSAPLTVADIDRWQRGMEGELEAVHEAAAKMKSARSAEDSANVVFAVNDMSTRDAGASAAGLSGERYQFVRTTLESAVANLSPLEMEMKLDQLPASMVDELKKGRESTIARMATELPADVVAALRPRAGELRKQSMALVGERLKAAGMVR